ncbi:YbhN family protein [Candidatus Saccharibacteria bacterium]|nr:YbhN family protein [Candidatus Saccharibacteria bacterium]
MFSNYTIKKILPRLIIVAIAVNLSFYICVIAVDISNVLGANLRDFISNIVPAAGAEMNPLAKVGGGILGGVSLFALGVGAIILIAINLGTVLVGILLIVAVLVLREVLVTVLIIISPIAFVLYLLPNTEKWFKKWVTEFARVLFIYPVIAFVWGATELLTFIMMKSLGDHPLIGFFMICLVQLVPVATIIPIMKMGGQALSQLQGLVQKGLDKTPIKDIGDSLGQAGKNIVGTALGDRLKSSAEKWQLKQDKDGNYLNRFGRKVSGSRLKAINAAQEKLRNAKTEEERSLAAQELNRATRTRIGSVAKGASGAVSFLTDLGNGNLVEGSKNLAEIAKSNTAGTQRIAKQKLDLENTAQSQRRKLAEQEYEISLKRRGDVIEHEAKMKHAQLASESGTDSPAWKVSRKMLEMFPGSGVAASYGAQMQGKLTEEATSLIEETGQIWALEEDENGNPQRVSSAISPMGVANVIGGQNPESRIEFVSADTGQKKTIEGGNLSAANLSDNDVNSLLTTFSNQVLKTNNLDDIGILQNAVDKFKNLDLKDNTTGQRLLETLGNNIINQKALIESRNYTPQVESTTQTETQAPERGSNPPNDSSDTDMNAGMRG